MKTIMYCLKRIKNVGTTYDNRKAVAIGLSKAIPILIRLATTLPRSQLPVLALCYTMV